MTTATKIDVYQIVTDRIIELLEKGTVPWMQPWHDGLPPMNLISKRPYQGINSLLLNSLGFERNLFLTWDQLKRLGGSVKQNEHGTVVVFWKTSASDPDKSSEKPNKRLLLRYYKVFNVSQCTGLPEEGVENISYKIEMYRPECENVISEMPNPPAIVSKGKQAYYHPEDDRIVIPTKKTFGTIEGYYSVLFHEVVHSTGHATRLGRKGIVEKSEFGSIPYAMEELIAEIGACYLCNLTGILNTQILNSAAYIQDWVDKLRNDKFFVLHAASHAQKAVEHIRNVFPEQKVVSQEESIPF